jgi:hypothetical protein
MHEEITRTPKGLPPAEAITEIPIRNLSEATLRSLDIRSARQRIAFWKGKAKTPGIAESAKAVALFQVEKNENLLRELGVQP